MKKSVFYLTVLIVCMMTIASLKAQMPEALDDDITIQKIMTIQSDGIRLAKNPLSHELYYARLNGSVYRVNLQSSDSTLVATAAQHGLASLAGFDIAPDGTFFIVGNKQSESNNIGIIIKGVGDDANGRLWSTVAQTEPYGLNTIFNHNFNAIAFSPDGQFLFVNSGARTDHGEAQKNTGPLAEIREFPITACILRLPIDAENLIIHNNIDSLKNNGYLYADGVRNHFDLAFAPNGDLFGVENSGDRDDAEELNWIRENHHYGFPWRMGIHDTPQQFPGYDWTADPFVNPQGLAASRGFFHDDSTYPQSPEGVVFTDPVLSIGPDADKFRDPADGLIKDASDEGIKIGTFTPHRSPLGLAFDNEMALPGEFRGNAFVLSWTNPQSSVLLNPFGDEGEDLLHIDLTKIAAEDRYEARVTRIVRHFSNPVDAVFLTNKLYVLETGLGNGKDSQLWELSFNSTITNQPPTANAAGPYTGFVDTPIVFDGSNSVDPDSDSLSYTWEFGDSATASGVSPSHNYSTSGVYQVTLTVDDDNSGMDIDTTTATISAPLDLSPPANVIAAAGDTVIIPFTLTNANNDKIDAFGVTVLFPDTLADFISVSSNGTLTNGWQEIRGRENNSGEIIVGAFDSNGTTSSGVLFSLALQVKIGVADSGTLRLHDFVDDLSGTTTTDGHFEVTASTTNQPPIANAAGPYTGIADMPIIFNGSNSLDPDDDSLSYTWEFGDSARANGVSPSHTYSASGVFQITLTVDDGNGGMDIDTTSATVIIAEPLDLSPPANVIASTGDTVIIPFTLTNLNNDKIDAFGVTILFPHTLADFININSSGALTNGWQQVRGQENNPGEITVGAFDSSGTTASGVLFNIALRVKSGVAGSGTLRLRNFVDDLSTVTTTDGNLEVTADTASVVRVIGSAGVSPGSMVSVPIRLEAQGDENTIGFSLAFDTTIVRHLQAQRGRDADTALLIANDTDSNSGRLGLAIALPPGETFAVGSNEIIVITFEVDANPHADSTTIFFVDEPVAREAVDVNAAGKPAVWLSGTIRLLLGYEADLTPRPHGNNDGTVTIADWVQMGRFATGLATLSSHTNEFQRADCAPAPCGDGILSLADWTQAGRYAAQLDSIELVCGPATGSSVNTKVAASRPASTIAKPEIPTDAIRMIRLQTRDQSFTNDHTNAVLVKLEALGDENALGFSLSYNPAVFTFVSAKQGDEADRASLHINTNHIVDGRVGIALALQPGETFEAGECQAIIIEFDLKSNVSVSSETIGFTDQPVSGELVSYKATVLATEWQSVTVTLESSTNGDNLPQAYELEQNFPNPFNPVTTIAFSLPLSGHVTLKVYDLKGNEVTILVDGQYAVGRHPVTLDADKLGLGSGIYFYKLQSENFVQTRKFILMK